jgi:gamma-glutamyltranspeptidase/glutathione hydrolase
MPKDLVGKVGPKKAAAGGRAVCASQDPNVTETMLNVMKDGGNAMDAVIAGALAQATVQQDMTNHAGMITALVHEAKTGTTYQLNAMGTLVPGMALFRPIPPGVGYFSPPTAPPSACIPGFMPGLKALHEKFGSKPWASLCEPAIHFAEDGYIVSSFQHLVWAQTGEFYLYTESGREWLTPDGFYPQVGDRRRNPALAQTLRRLAAEGPDYFTTGDWGKHFVERANSLGWMIKQEHMTAIPPRWQEPLRFKHKGYEVVQLAPPERQGVYCAIVLGILRHLDAASLGHYSQSPDALYYLAHALRRAHWETGLLHDPQVFDVPVETWLSEEYLAAAAEIIKKSRPKVDMTEHVKFNCGPVAMAAVGMRPPKPAAAPPAPGKPAGADQPDPPAGSCELSLVDGEGNWVQFMNTLQSGGIPGEVVDGVCMVGSHQITHMLSPIAGWLTGGGRMRCVIGNTLVMKDGQPVMSLGTPGNVHCTIPQVLTNLLDYGMEPYAAIDAPRLLPMGDDYSIEIESRVGADVAPGLAKLGVLLKPHPRYDFHMGSFQMCWRDEKGLHSTADPRRAGAAAGY